MQLNYRDSEPKSSYACFGCRRSWKSRDRILRCTVDDEKCPECGHLSSHMGFNFKPPSRQKIAAWKRIELLNLAGLSPHGPTMREVRVRVATAHTEAGICGWQIVHSRGLGPGKYRFKLCERTPNHAGKCFWRPGVEAVR